MNSVANQITAFVVDSTKTRLKHMEDVLSLLLLENTPWKERETQLLTSIIKIENLFVCAIIT